MGEEITVDITAQVVLYNKAEAEEWDSIIVTSATRMRVGLYNMYVHEGWRALGFESWEAYLQDISGRARLTPKTLRKHARAGLLEAEAGYDVGAFKEGSIRPINDILSNRKGFQDLDRVEALDLALEYAGDDPEKLTSALATRAAKHVASERAVLNSEATDLILRYKRNEVSAETAGELVKVFNKCGNNVLLEYIVQWLSDPHLANMLLNLTHNGGDVAEDVIEQIYRTGYVPGSNGSQMIINEATKEHFLGYLHEPERMKRAEKASLDRERMMNIAHAARQVIMHEFDGREPDTERYPYHYLMYLALRDAGMVGE